MRVLCQNARAGDGFLDVYLVNPGPVPILSGARPGTLCPPNGLCRNRGDGHEPQTILYSEIFVVWV